MEDKIKELTKQVQELRQSIEELKGIQCEGTVLETEEMLEDKNVIEIITTTKYTEGKLTETITRYKYKEIENTYSEVTLEEQLPK